MPALLVNDASSALIGVRSWRSRETTPLRSATATSPMPASTSILAIAVRRRARYPDHRSHLARERPTEPRRLPQVIGEQVDAGPFGIAVNKDNKELTEALEAAVNAIIEDGTYKKILEKWGAETGAIDKAVVNGGK
ncbi:hypothetical protein SALBM217S_10779 [Streptomyces griseoloalbus]